MPCGCKCRPTRQTFPAPCTDCGPYGSTCCLKMTGLGETWFFRTYIDGPFTPDVFGGSPGALEIRWVDGDECVPLTEFESTAYYLGWGQQSNLCGGMTTSGPCNENGHIVTHGIDESGNTYRGQLSLIWRVAEDCSEVVFTLYYYDEYGELTRYTGTASTDWIVSGTPITIGPFTLTLCPPGEPARKLYNICCWQVTAASALCSFSVQQVPEGSPLPETCNGDPRYQIHNTEQCGSGSISGSVSNPGDTSCSTLTMYRYSVSDDYSTVTLLARGVVQRAILKSNGGYEVCTVYFTEDGGPVTSTNGNWQVFTIPFTPEWFLTPITLEATGSNGELLENGIEGCAWEGATLTLSVCGYDVGGDPCWGDKLVCVDVAYDTSFLLNGTFAMPWDGDEYATEWMDRDASHKVRVRLKESVETPGTWETWLDIWNTDTNEVVSEVIGSEVIDCDPAGTVSGGGDGVVNGENVTMTIHECEPRCFDPDFPIYVTIPDDAEPYVGGTYEMVYSETTGSYSTGWTPVQPGGGGYQVQYRLERGTDPAQIAICEVGGALTLWVLYGDYHNVTTEDEETDHISDICWDCETALPMPDLEFVHNVPGHNIEGLMFS